MEKDHLDSPHSIALESIKPSILHQIHFCFTTCCLCDFHKLDAQWQAQLTPQNKNSNFQSNLKASLCIYTRCLPTIGCVINKLIKIAFSLTVQWKIESVGILINRKSPNEFPSPLRILMLHLKLITPGNALPDMALTGLSKLFYMPPFLYT